MDRILRRLVQGLLPSSQLPQTIDVWDLEEGLADLRSRSLEVTRKQQVEWGGCIVLVEDHLRLLHPVCGRKDGVDPKCKPVDHDNYVGFAHTHLPDATSGKPYIGFSERDFRGTLADGDNLALVCNGADVFALVRTADRTQSCRIPQDKEFKSWEQLYDNLILQARQMMKSDPEVRRRGSDVLNRVLWQANRQMCQNLGFAFYRGLWGQPLIRLYRP